MNKNRITFIALSVLLAVSVVGNIYQFSMNKSLNASIVELRNEVDNLKVETVSLKDTLSVKDAEIAEKEQMIADLNAEIEERGVGNEGGVDTPTEEGEYSEYDNIEYADDDTSESTGDYNIPETYDEVVAGLKANYENGMLTKEEYEGFLKDAKELLLDNTDSSTTTTQQQPQTQIPDEYANAPIEYDTGAVAPPLIFDGSDADYHAY